MESKTKTVAQRGMDLKKKSRLVEDALR